jgi:hypothetical protein
MQPSVHHKLARSLGTHRRRDAGAAAVELTLITPLLVLMLLLLVAAARLVSARQKVNDAAHQAARIAADAPSPGQAGPAADAAARAAIAAGAVSCRQLDVGTNTSAFRPGGQVSVQDLSLLHIPGTRAITSRVTAPIDRWRTTATNTP